MVNIQHNRAVVGERCLRGVLRSLLDTSFEEVSIEDGAPLGCESAVILFRPIEKGGNRVIPCYSEREAVLIEGIIAEMLGAAKLK